MGDTAARSIGATSGTRPAGRPKRRSARAAERTVHRKSPILVIETDDLIRGLLARWLGEGGYAVHARAAGDPAPEGGVRLVVADVASPRRAGALIGSLRAYRAPILIVSARFRRGLGASAAAARQLGVEGVLPKPFTRAELLAAVGEIIEDP
jgi:DNA-binding response OmpR family regulator